MKFIKWLDKQRNRQDNIGKLAQANHSDGNDCLTYLQLLNYLVENRVEYEFIQCLKDAKKEHTEIYFPKLNNTLRKSKR